MSAKKTKIVSKNVEVESWGWGVVDGMLVQFNGTSSSDLCENPTVWAFILPEDELQKAREELEQSELDRYSDWPTIEKYIQKLQEVKQAA